MIPNIGIENSLERLLYMGRIQEEVNILGQKLTIKVLDSGEQQEVFEATSSYEPVTRLRAIQHETLARAIIAFNGVPINFKINENDEKPFNSREIKQKLIEQNLELFKKASHPLIDELFQEYEKLRIKQENQFSELKKKLKKTGQESDGKSEKQ
ncbi:MAG: hypothetical protein ACFFG0_36010 [Candidatus Thorarchaeota archaeon]